MGLAAAEIVFRATETWRDWLGCVLSGKADSQGLCPHTAKSSHCMILAAWWRASSSVGAVVFLPLDLGQEISTGF